MAWHEGKPEYRSSPNSKEVRENFAYLKALADLLSGAGVTAEELSQLHESGVVKADLVKLHAITSTHTEINQLHGSGVVKADLVKLHDITSSATEINQLHGSGVVKADLGKLHGITLSYAQINALINNVPPVGSIIAYVPGYFTNGSNAGFTYRMVSANTVAAVNALLNPSGWYVCNGAALNDADSGIFNGAGRYLPNLTDDRFLMGDTAAGTAGGSAAHTHTMAHTHTIAHTHTTGNCTLTISQIPKHRHKVSNDAQGGTGNTESVVVTNAALHGSTAFWNYSHGGNSSEVGGGAAHNHGSTGNPSNANSGASSVGSTGSSSLLPTYLSCFYLMRVK